LGRHLYATDSPAGPDRPAFGRRFFGSVLFPAGSVDTDDLDLFLGIPQAVDDSDNFQELAGVEGIPISRSEISAIAVLEQSTAE